MALYSSRALDLLMIWECTWARSPGRVLTSVSRVAMACFSGAVALFIVPGEFRSVRSVRATASVLLCWTWSEARLAPVGLDRYTIASGRSASIWLRNAPVGTPVTFLIVVAWDSVSAPRAVRNVANTYSAISESTGTRDEQEDPLADGPETQPHGSGLEV